MMRRLVRDGRARLLSLYEDRYAFPAGRCRRTQVELLQHVARAEVDAEAESAVGARLDQEAGRTGGDPVNRPGWVQRVCSDIEGPAALGGKPDRVKQVVIWPEGPVATGQEQRHSVEIGGEVGGVVVPPHHVLGQRVAPH